MLHNPNNPMKKQLIIFLILFTAGSCTLLMKRKTFAKSAEALAGTLPDRVGNWTAEPEDRIYDAETIFDYIDGAGEVYTAYDMRSCLSRRYVAKDGPTIVLDIFDMGSSENAFGVFTHDRDGDPLDVGQGALYRPGWLSFWKDRFFVSLYVEEETSGAKKALLELATAAASGIKERGPQPTILLKLPPEGLQNRGVHYLRHHMLLNYHYYLADENILNLGPHTDAVFAAYRRDGKSARLLLVLYPDGPAAAKAHGSFIRHYLPENVSAGAVYLEDGKWSTAALKDNLLTVVLESDSRQLAEDLIRDVKRLP